LRNICVPSKSSQLANCGPHSGKSHTRKHLTEVVCGPYQSTANTNAHCAEKRNVTLAEQILEVASKRAGGRDGENISCWKPSGTAFESKIFFDEAKGSTGKIENDL